MRHLIVLYQVQRATVPRYVPARRATVFDKEKPNAIAEVYKTLMDGFNAWLINLEQEDDFPVLTENHLLSHCAHALKTQAKTVRKVQ